MPQSLAFVLVHVVFSTRERRGAIDPTVRSRLHAYMATLVRNTGCECYRVNGTADHVHLAVRLSREVDIASLVREVKASSSRFLKTQAPELAEFAWQRGYGAFSVGPADRESLIRYIDDQEKHHANQSFQDELRMFLVKYGVEFDERYVWD